MSAYRNAVAIAGWQDANPGTEVGFSLKKAVKKVGRGAKAVGRGAVKATKTVAKAHVAVPMFAAKTTFRGAKAVGRGTVRGTKATGRFVKKNPIKSLALLAPGALPAYGAYRLGKKIAKRKKKPGQPALTPYDAESPEPAQTASFRAPASSPASYAAPSPGDDYMPEEETGEGEGEETEEEETTEDTEESDESTEESGDEESSDEDETETTQDGENDMRDEYVGLDEIAGFDEIAGDEYVGAARPAKKGSMGKNAVLVREKGYNKSRRQPLAFTSGSVAAAASATITQIPQTLFRGRKLVVASSIASAFTVDNVSVGNQSQFAATGSQPAEAFLPTTTGDDNMTLDTCPPGMSITMQVTNISGGAAIFRATLFGDSVQ